MLLAPTSAAASKSGDALKRRLAVAVSTLTILKSAPSLPAAITKVAESLTVIVAALNDVAIFSVTVKVSLLVNAGGVISGLPGPGGGAAASESQNLDAPLKSPTRYLPSPWDRPKYVALVRAAPVDAPFTGFEIRQYVAVTPVVAPQAGVVADPPLASPLKTKKDGLVV